VTESTPPAASNLPSQAVAQSAAGNAPATAKQTDFDAFWRELRPALLSANADAVARMTVFPLAVSGEMDDDAVRSIERTAFPAVFRQLLAQDVGLSPEPEALSDYVKRVNTLPSSTVDGTTARVASLEFGLTSQGWRLVRAYLGDAE
jgi:hypothetical protein